MAASAVLGWVEMPVPAQSVRRGSSKTQPANETAPAKRTYRPRPAEIFRVSIAIRPRGPHREDSRGRPQKPQNSGRRAAEATVAATRQASYRALVGADAAG